MQAGIYLAVQSPSCSGKSKIIKARGVQGEQSAAAGTFQARPFSWLFRETFISAILKTNEGNTNYRLILTENVHETSAFFNLSPNDIPKSELPQNLSRSGATGPLSDSRGEARRVRLKPGL